MFTIDKIGKEEGKDDREFMFSIMRYARKSKMRNGVGIV